MPFWTAKTRARQAMTTPPSLQNAGIEHNTYAPVSRFLPGDRPRLIAHRGLALDGAENTMRAFDDALAAGATMLETDTRATRDGRALAFHDSTLDRVTDHRGPISRRTWQDLSEVRVAGSEPIALLEDVLSTYRDVPINIDVKDAAAIVPAASAIASARAADRVCVTSFDGRVAQAAVREVRERTGRTPVRSPSRGRMAGVLAATAVETPRSVTRAVLRPFGALQVPTSFRGVPVVTPRVIARAHDAGCEVHVWTIDEPDQMRSLIEMGVDGIISNRVDLLSRLLRSSAAS